MERKNCNWNLLLKYTYLPALLTHLFQCCPRLPHTHPGNTNKADFLATMQMVSMVTGAYFASSGVSDRERKVERDGTKWVRLIDCVWFPLE